MVTVAISSVVAGDRVGPGMDITVHTSAGSSAGDKFYLGVAVGAVRMVAFSIAEVRPAAGSRNPVLTIGWSSFGNFFWQPNLPGIADSAVINLIVEWFDGPGTLLATGTLSTVWDPNSFTYGLLRFGLADNTALLLQILDRVTKNLPSLP